jgi:RNA polymerase I-specific transcription initiation factor RRN6
LVISNLTLCPGANFSPGEDHVLSTLPDVYDRIGDYWLASLPIKVSNLSRLTKFNYARNIATELYLASIAVSIRDKSSHVIGSTDPKMSTISLPILSRANGAYQGESGEYPSSQIVPISSPPTPAQMPSLPSEGSATSTEVTGDSAILRLRQYAVSIAQPSRMGNSSLLSLWPSSPGEDPATYSWKADRQSGTDRWNHEGIDHRRRREESRRRKKTEKFLARGTAIESEVVSQPQSAPFGSQPAVALHAASSQTVNELPMTQLDRGLFGSRSVQAGRKRQTKRRAAGF